MKKLFLYVFLVLSLAACRKDMEETTITDTVYTPPVIKVNGDIAGVVTDEQGNAIEGAIVHLGAEQKTTGAGGFFVFKNAVLNANGTYVKVDQPGYFHASKRFFPKANSVNYVNLTLMAKNNIGFVSATAGGKVQMSNGASVTLPANGVVAANGSAYAGEVSVEMRWLDPSSEKVITIMPGNLQGINKERKEVALGTYGMIVVELSGATGEPLNIAPGSTAELRFPIPASLRNSAPAEIPLWHFDENTGLWREEGSAIKTGNEYVGQVAHFSFWNCDYPFPLVNMTGQLTTSGGVPLVNIWVGVALASSGMTASGTTDNEGVFSGKIPANEALILKVYNFCGEVVYEMPIGPYSQDIDLGTISFDNATLSYSTISGTLLDCNGDPLPQGLVKICNGSGCTFIMADAQGNFVKAVPNCNSDNLTIKAFDLAANMESNSFTFSIEPSIDAGNISVCAAQITEYIRVNINGDEFTYLTPLFEGTPGALNRIGSYQQDSSYTIDFTFPVGAVGTYSGNGVRFSYYDNSAPTYSVGYCFNPCNSMEVNITQFGNVGEYIQGTFSGTMNFYNASQQVFPDVPITGEFSVIRTQ